RRTAAGRNDLVQPATDDVDDIELAVVALSERSDGEGRIEQLFRREPAAAIGHEAPNNATAVIRKQIAADERGNRRAAIDIATGNRDAERSIVVVHRVDEICGRCGTAVIRNQTLAAIPPVVAATLNTIDFLARALTHIADPKIAGCGVEAPPPRVTEAPRVDLRTIVRGHRVIRRAHRSASERIVWRNFIRRS